MSLLFTGATSHRVDLAAQPSSLGITRGTILLWLYVPTAAAGALVTLNDPVASLLRANFNMATVGTVLRFTLDLATTDLDIQATLSNFAAWGTGKWVKVALQWATPNEAGGVAGDQKLLIGDLTTALAEPSSYSNRVAGVGNLTATDSTSFWKIGNRRQNDSPAPGRMAYVACFDRSSGTQLTTAEMEAWFRWPWTAGASWMHELGADLAGGNPIDLTGKGHNGTITGATVADHPPLNPFGMARWAALEGGRIESDRRARKLRVVRAKRLRAKREDVVVLTQSGPPIIDGVLAIPVTYGLSATGSVAAAGASIDGVLSIPITYGLSATGTVVAGPAAINGALTIAITYGLTATGTVQAAGTPSGTNWTVPYRGGHRWSVPYQRLSMPSVFASIVTRDQDFLLRVGPITGFDTNGVAISYSGTTADAWWAAYSDSDTSLGGVNLSVTAVAGARFTVSAEASLQNTAFAGLADKQTIYLIVKAPGDFRVAIPYTFRSARVI